MRFKLSPYYVINLAFALALTPYAQADTPTDTASKPVAQAEREFAPEGGWASQNGGTQGGAKAVKLYVVSSRSDLLRAIKEAGSEPKIIRVASVVDMTEGKPFASADDQKKRSEIKLNSNTTLIGVGQLARIVNGTIKINKVEQVIVRNLTIQNPCDIAPEFDEDDGDTGNWNAEYDGIVVDGSKNVWLDHLTFTDAPVTDDLARVERGHLKQCHDGALDIKNGSNYVTVSNNVFMLHDKNNLVGASDSTTKDKGKLKVTFVGNVFQDVSQRSPRVRFGQVHVYNNLYLGDKKRRVYAHQYSIGVGKEARVLSENNDFRIAGADECKDMVKAYKGKYFLDKGSELNGRALNGESCGFNDDINWKPPYRYSLLPTRQVQAEALRNAGAGKFD